MKKLSPEAMAILDAARDVDNPRAEDRARVKRAVLSAVAASTTAVVSATAASKAAAATTSAAGTATAAAGTAAAGTAAAGTAAGITGLGAVTAKALVTLSLVGASVGVAVSRPWEPAQDVVAVAETRQVDEPIVEPTEAPRVVAPVLEAPDSEPEPEPEVEQAPPETSEVEPRAARRIAVPNPAQVDTAEPAPQPEPDTLAAELSLLRRANVALSQGDHRGALAALDEHAANFPRGVMIAERNGTRALVLCEARAPGAREAAERFLQSHSRSPIAQRIRDNCLD